jgi:hypothetical protein
MQQRIHLRCAICGQEAVKVETKLDGTHVLYCGKHRRPSGATLDEVLRRIRLKQAARKFLHKRT